jgi:zinc protease
VLGSILTGARTARITKALVYDEQAAASASARQVTNEDVGDFVITLTPRPGHSLTNLEAATDAIIERLKKEGPTREEIQKAIAGEELNFVQSLETNLGKAFRLADGAGYMGNPGAFQEEYKNVLSVTADDVKRVANAYLTSGRVVLSVVPVGKLSDAARPDASTRVTDYDEKKPEGGK